MQIRTTTDPISLHEVDMGSPHLCLYEGDGENGLEIFFESEENLQSYKSLGFGDEHKIVEGSSSDDYVAEG